MTNPIELLLIEDNPGDVELIKAGFEEVRMRVNISVIADGQKAVEFVQAGQNLPDLIVLDLNLPKVNGIDVLKEIRKHESSTGIPVVVFTSSEADSDIASSYREHANTYISKPVAFNQFVDAIKSIETFWIELAKLPINKQTGCNTG